MGLAAVAAPTAPARCSVVEPLTVTELSRRAARVVVADVRTTASSWVGGHLETRVELVLIAPWKGPGQPGDAVVVRQLGGQLGDLSQRVVGAPVLQVGERVVVFLVAGTDRTHRLLGLDQGVYRVGVTPEVAPAAGSAVRPPFGRGAILGVPASPHRALDQAGLAALEAQVRAAALPPSR